MRYAAVTLSLIAVAAAGCSAGQVAVSLDPTTAPPSMPASGASVEPSPAASPEQSVVPSASAGPVESAASQVSAPTGFLPPGSVARVTGDGVRIRAEPSISAAQVMTVDAGQLLALNSGEGAFLGPIEADGHSWYPVAILDHPTLPSLSDGPMSATGDGWVAG